MLQYAVIFGALVSFGGSLSYIRATLRGETKPNRITWLLWAIAPMIATAAALLEGVRWAVLPVFMSGFGPLLIFLASFVNKNAYWKLERFDYFCGFLSVLALILWAITRDASVAIIFAIASDGLAAAPTLIKLWKFPETESVFAWYGGLFSALTGFLAIKTWNFASYGFAVYLVVINIVLILSFYSKKIRASVL